MLLSVSALLLTSCLIWGCSSLKPAPKPDPDRVAPGVTIEGKAVGGMTFSQVQQTAASMAAERAIPAQNAGFSDITGEVTPSRNGQTWDVPATAARIIQAPAYSDVSPVYTSLAPSITEDMLRSAARIGAYRTPILDDSPKRVENLRLTAKLINNTVVHAGEEFSFNRITGEPTEERGFQAAPILKNGEKVMGLGGGMCQVSTTLYNAVLEANLQVVERHRHSQPVAYVPEGRDATTFSDKDFRFVNDSRKPLIIRALLKDGEVLAELWSYSPKE